MTTRIDVLIKILDYFKDVDDLYIIERLYAVAYGCSTRMKNKDDLEKLANVVYEIIFKNDSPPMHILIRDYAKGVIDSAIARGIKINIDYNKVLPPYSSDVSIPTEEDIIDYENRILGEDSKNNEYQHLKCTITCDTSSDFRIYKLSPIINNWIPISIEEKDYQTPRLKLNNWVDLLNDEQKKKYEDYHSAIELKKVIEFHSKTEISRAEMDDEGYNINDSSEHLKSLEDKLVKSLDSNQKEYYDEFVREYIQDTHKYDKKYNYYDINNAERWMLKRVLELGWKPSLFGAFDNSIEYSGRTSHKPERIGKKYIWIALHEFTAFLADNFILKDSSTMGVETENYKGAWQINLRDIDPTCLVNKTNKPKVIYNDKCWWFREYYSNWPTDDGIDEWLKDRNNIPNIKNYIQLSYNNNEWVMLESSFDFEKIDILMVRNYNDPYCSFWFYMRSYFIKKGDKEKLLKSINGIDLLSSEAPNLEGSHDCIEILLGEHFQHPCYQYYNRPYYGKNGWYKGFRTLPVDILVSAESYFRETGGLDCSIDNSFNILLPSNEIVEAFDLRWNGKDGYFYDKDNLIAFDPSVNHWGPNALLLRYGYLKEFLKIKNYDIVWVITGEKRYIQPNLTHKFKGRQSISGVGTIDNDDLSYSQFVKYKD